MPGQTPSSPGAFHAPVKLCGFLDTGWFLGTLPSNYRKRGIMKILLVGDIVGKPGLTLTATILKQYLQKYQIDLCIVNGENVLLNNVGQEVSQSLYDNDKIIDVGVGKDPGGAGFKRFVAYRFFTDHSDHHDRNTLITAQTADFLDELDTVDNGHTVIGNDQIHPVVFHLSKLQENLFFADSSWEFE